MVLFYEEQSISQDCFPAFAQTIRLCARRAYILSVGNVRMGGRKTIP